MAQRWVVFLLSCLPAGLRSQEASLASIVKTRTLDNGLTVIVAEDHRNPLATVMIAVRGGALAQDSGQDGLAHLFEHLLFSAYHGDPTRFNEEAFWIDGGYNGETNEEYNAYLLAVPPDRTGKAIGLLGDLLTHIKFSDRAVRDERPIVLNEIQRDEATPEEGLARDVDQGLWGPAWSWKDVTGDSASLTRLSAADLQAGFGRYYVPNNAALIVTGDVSADEVFDRARKELGGWRSGPEPLQGRATWIAAPPARTSILVRADAVQDVTFTVRMVGPAVVADTAGTYAADALVDLLNDPTSAFQRRLVTYGPFESIAASYETAAHGGSFTFRGTLSPGRAQDGIQMLLAELDEMDRLDGATPADLVIARRRGAVEEAMARDGEGSLAGRLAFWWCTTGLEYFLHRETRLAAVTLPDLQRVAGQYVTRRPRSIGILAPQATADTILKWLRTAFHQ